jgi:hypothetical protein
MKVLKRFLSRGNSDSDISPALPSSVATKSSQRSLQTAPPSTRGKRMSTKLVAGGSNGNNGKPAGASRRNQDKRQQKIQQFLNNDSLARRTWEETRSQSLSEPPMTIATESSSSSSLNSIVDEDAMDASSTMVAVGEITVQEEQEKSERMSSSLRSSSAADDKAADDEKSSTFKKKKKRRATEKKISWDASVEVDQSKRELTRQFRNPLPEWKQRQMAHRVHHCNVRKAEVQVFKEQSLDTVAENSPAPCEIPVSQEIAVTPAAEGWFERCDRDISAEYLQNIDLVFRKNVSSAKSVDFFSTVGKVKGSNKSVASF